MTVCIATDGYYPNSGGISTFYGHLSKLLSSYGNDVIVLTIDPDEHPRESPDEITRRKGITIVTLKKSFFDAYDNFKRFFRPGGYQAYQWLAIGMAMRKWLQANAVAFSIDIIEVTDYGGIGFFLADTDLPPVVITAHGSLLQYANYNFTPGDEQVRLIKKLEQLSFDNAAGIIAHSYLNQKDLCNYTTTPVYFATAPWTSPSTDGDNIPEEKYLLVIGGMQIVKGAITMAKALSICKQKNLSCKLYWVGPDFYVAPGVEKMSVYIQQHFPEIWNTYFIWLGEQPRAMTQAKLRSAMAVVIPSDWETFNYIALEAAAFEKPIIISKNAGAEYIFTHGDDALKIEAINPEELAGAMVTLLSDQELRKKLGKNVKTTLSEKFLPEKIVNERMVVYDKCLTGRQPIESFAVRSRFLKNYLKPYRKHYFGLRAFAKKILKKG